jgi:hypothetical protein
MMFFLRGAIAFFKLGSYLILISRQVAKAQRKNAEELKVVDEPSNAVFDEIGIEVDE